MDGQFVELLPDFSALLRWFQAADLLTPSRCAELEQRWRKTVGARHTLAALRNFREELRKEVLAWEQVGAVSRSMVGKLNALLAAHPMRTRLNAGGKKFSTELWFALRQPDDLFAPLAYSAAMLFANVDPWRVRKCEQCVLHFQDTSKKGTRRWCSMQLCGNRRKVAAYAARQRKIRARD
jgi:predicted RNA-binding Zn ribbon-like protein